MKICCGCKIEKEEKYFFKNKTKSDRLQSQCKQCAKDKWGKWFDCSTCGEKFYVKHRNVSRRKTTICVKCIKEYIIKKNIERTKGYTFNNKGYKFVRDSLEKSGYKLNHRKILEEHLGRLLEKHEVVHHVDGNRLNNIVENLYLTDAKGHSKAHRSLELIGYELVQKGLIVFNQELGEYVFCLRDPR